MLMIAWLKRIRFNLYSLDAFEIRESKAVTVNAGILEFRAG
jgi:hypothetical protein